MKQSKCPTWSLRKAPTGPLAMYIDDYCSWLYKQGFCRNYIGLQIRQVAEFSCWLSCNDIAVTEITDVLIEQFFGKKNTRQLINQGKKASLRRLIAYLRQNGVTLSRPETLPLTAVEILINEFGRYLLADRGLSPKTVNQYRPTIGQFLYHKYCGYKIDLTMISGTDITQFIHSTAKRISAVRGKVVVNAMRAFLRYGIHRHQLCQDLLLAVPKVASWSQSGIIKAISPKDTESLLSSCDLDTVQGIRDFAILMLLARLGLRASEIASLNLDDIDWDSGTLSFNGKSRKHSCLPLTEEVGAALAGGP